jgi:hypothetical protein
MIVIANIFFSVKVKWKMSLETEKFPEFHLTGHQITSYPSGAVSFIFSCRANVRCTLTHTVNSTSSSSSLSGIMAGKSASMFTLQQLHSDYQQHQIR